MWRIIQDYFLEDLIHFSIANIFILLLCFDQYFKFNYLWYFFIHFNFHYMPYYFIYKFFIDFAIHFMSKTLDVVFFLNYHHFQNLIYTTGYYLCFFYIKILVNRLSEAKDSSLIFKVIWWLILEKQVLHFYYFIMTKNNSYPSQTNDKFIHLSFFVFYFRTIISAVC